MFGVMGEPQARLGDRRTYSILCVEDEPETRRMMDLFLTQAGYVVRGASNIADARTQLQAGVPDLILLDVFLPHESGFAFLKEIQQRDDLHNTPVIIVSALSGTEHIVEGLKRGARDYVTKPIVFPILLARMETALRDSSAISRLELKAELLSRKASLDALTGLPNRRSFFEAFHRELARASRYEHPVSVMMVDVDHFKTINDKHGHQLGDRVIREVANTIQAHLRVTDMAGRYGGDEFCVLLPETTSLGARVAAERVRQAVSALTFAPEDVRVTVSIGVAGWDAPEGRAPDLIGLADEALFDAKSGQRDRVRLYRTKESK